MITSFGKNKQLDQTLTILLGKATSVMEPAIQAVLMHKGSSLRKSFSVEMVTVKIMSDLAIASISENDGQVKISNKLLRADLKATHASTSPYGLFHFIHFLSAFYIAAEKSKATDLEELHIKILQSIHALLSGTVSKNFSKHWLDLSKVMPQILCTLCLFCKQSVNHFFRNVVVVVRREGAGGASKRAS